MLAEENLEPMRIVYRKLLMEFPLRKKLYVTIVGRWDM
jgi:hypothetical protein